jgi:hypothetical protein
VATRRLGGAVISCGLQSRRICRWRCRLSLPPLRLPDVWTGPEVDSTTSAGYREKSGTAILYLILSPHRHMATTSDPMRWRGSIAEHVCWRRTPVRWAWCRTGPSRRAPVTTPSPSAIPGGSVLVLAILRPLGALQLRRSRRDGDASKCAGSVCKRTYRYHLWLLS